MATMTIHFPNFLLLSSDGSIAQFEKRSRFLLALKYFELGELSSGQAAALAGMNRARFLQDVSAAGVPIVKLSKEEIAEEIAFAKAG